MIRARPVPAAVALHNELKALSDLEPTQRPRKAALQEELGREQASYRKTLMDLQVHDATPAPFGDKA